MSIANRRKNVSRDAHTLCRASTILAAATGTMVRLMAMPIVLTTFFAFQAEADSDYRKVCEVGVNLTVLAEDASANSCRAIATASNSQDAKNENLLMLTTPINVNDKSARLTSASLAANGANANHSATDFAVCAKFWVIR
jgi:hypothetical protein